MVGAKTNRGWETILFQSAQHGTVKGHNFASDAEQPHNIDVQMPAQYGAAHSVSVWSIGQRAAIACALATPAISLFCFIPRGRSVVWLILTDESVIEDYFF
jgi:hypothetical protein